MIGAMSETAFGVKAGGGRRSGWRLACLWLVLVLAVVAFETGRHSVHHLNDSGADACVIASAVGHLPIVEAPPAVTVPVDEVVGLVAADAAPPDPSAHPLGAHQGRAPPLSLSA